MNREIKFRSWSGEKFYYWGFINSVFVSPIYKDDAIIKEVQQFTGLKDKNGKEIYEGDITNIDGLKVQVEWSNGAFIVRYFNIPTQSYLGHFDELDIEVIGNIYEDGHLLNPGLIKD